jgi:hypothetical protein
LFYSRRVLDILSGSSTEVIYLCQEGYEASKQLSIESKPSCL